MKRIKNAVAIAFLVLAPSAVEAKKGSSDLAGLTERASVIARGTVERIDEIGEDRFAVLNVKETLKGAPRSLLTFYATRTWLCDSTWVELGEEVLVFLRPAADGVVRRGERPLPPNQCIDGEDQCVEPINLVVDSGTGLFRFASAQNANLDAAFTAPKAWKLSVGPDVKLPNGENAFGPWQVNVATLLRATQRCVADPKRCREEANPPGER